VVDPDQGNGLGAGRDKNDWDFFLPLRLATQHGTYSFFLDSVLNIYSPHRSLGYGRQTPRPRKLGGPVFSFQPRADPNPIAPAMVEKGAMFNWDSDLPE